MSALGWLSPQALADLDSLIAERVAAEVDRRLASLNTESSPYMSVVEVAAYLRCSRQRVDDLLSQGRLTRHKDGHRTLVERAELVAYLERRG